MPKAPATAKVIAASWNGGTLPVAAVNSAKSDHSAIAPRPVRVALREDTGQWSVAQSSVARALTTDHSRLTTHAMYWPPLIDSVEPVMKPPSSEARKTTARPISSGVPRRPTGICGMIFVFSTSGSIACTISVPM